MSDIIESCDECVNARELGISNTLEVPPGA